MFAKRLRMLILEKDVTFRDIHRATGISHSNIGQYASGTHMPNAANLIKLCSYFNISSDWLLGLSDFRKLK